MNPQDLAALRLLAGSAGALCTLTGVEGSFSRAVGAHLAVAWDGRMRGSLADGCLERDLALQAQRLRRQAPRILRYGRGSDIIDFRLPCGSGLDILIDPAPDRRAIRAALSALRDRRPASLDLPDPAGKQRLCLPPLRLEVFGAAPECQAVARLARAMGITCALNPSGRPPARRPDPWTAVLLLSHDHERDEGILDWALDSEACHIAAIGGARARQRRAAHLAARHDPPSLKRLHSPAGLIPAARDPATLALSVLAGAVAAHQALAAAATTPRGATLTGG